MAFTRRPGNRGAGFLDLLIAVALSAILLAIGVPRLVAIRAPTAVNAAAQQIAGDIQVARMRAIARNVRYRVNFNPSAKTYTLERESPPGSNIFVVDGATQKLPSGVSFTAPVPQNPVFSTTGLLPTQITLQVSTPAAHSKTVTLNVLGRTKLS